MMKRMILALCLVLCCALLCACAGSKDNGTRYDVVTGSSSTAAPTQNVFGSDTALSATTITAAPVTAEPVNYTAVLTPAPTVRGEYAGATPVVIDPIDKPTPTPVPALSFEYETYDATRLHLSFQAPMGWSIDDSASDSYTIVTNDTRADYLACLTITVVPVSANYTSAELKTELSNRIAAIKGDFYSFSSTKAASRTLLDKDGFYADYTATLDSGVKVKGRIHVTCVDKKLYILQIETPAGYFETYKDALYNKFRHTVKITQ